MGGSFVATMGFSQWRDHIQDVHHVPFSVPHFVVAAVFFSPPSSSWKEEERWCNQGGGGASYGLPLKLSHSHPPPSPPL